MQCVELCPDRFFSLDTALLLIFSTRLQLLDWTQCYNDSILGSSGLHKCDTFKSWSVGLYSSKSYMGIPDSQCDGCWRYSFWVRWVVKVGSLCWNECLYQKRNLFTHSEKLAAFMQKGSLHQNLVFLASRSQMS